MNLPYLLNTYKIPAYMSILNDFQYLRLDAKDNWEQQQQ